MKVGMLESLSKFRETISPFVEMLRTALTRGVATGEFRPDVDALDFYVTLVGMGYYIVSSRFTLDAFLGRNYMEQPAQESITAMHLDAAWLSASTSWTRRRLLREPPALKAVLNEAFKPREPNERRASSFLHVGPGV
jgi:hypothetical protein